MAISQADIDKFRANEHEFREKARRAQEAHNQALRNAAIDQKLANASEASDIAAESEHREQVKNFEEAYRGMRGFQGYDTIVAILLRLMDFYMKLAPILHYNVLSIVKEIPIIGALPGHAIVSLKRIKEQMLAEDPGLAVLPVITHGVNVDATGKLAPDSLRFLQNVVTRNNNADFDVLQKEFDLVVLGWLQLHNPAYKVNANGEVVRYTYNNLGGGVEGAVITPQLFAEMRDAPETGLTAYMQKNLSMQSEFTLEPNPTPKASF